MRKLFLSLIVILLVTACSSEGTGGAVSSNAPGECQPTPGDSQGPYYIADAPLREILTPPDETGQKLRISGTIMNEDCLPIANAVVDVWHAGPDRKYSDEWYRGKLLTDEEGRYEFESIYPGQYRIGLGVRPAHIHFKISSPGYAGLNTQLYFKDDPYLTSRDSRAGFGSDNPRLIIDLEAQENERKGTFNLVLSP